jgi:hypothetical protein
MHSIVTTNILLIIIAVELALPYLANTIRIR